MIFYHLCHPWPLSSSPLRNLSNSIARNTCPPPTLPLHYLIRGQGPSLPCVLVQVLYIVLYITSKILFPSTGVSYSLPSFRPANNKYYTYTRTATTKEKANISTSAKVSRGRSKIPAFSYTYNFDYLFSQARFKGVRERGREREGERGRERERDREREREREIFTPSFKIRGVYKFELRVLGPQGQRKQVGRQQLMHICAGKSIPSPPPMDYEATGTGISYF